MCSLDVIRVQRISRFYKNFRCPWFNEQHFYVKKINTFAFTKCFFSDKLVSTHIFQKAIQPWLLQTPRMDIPVLPEPLAQLSRFFRQRMLLEKGGKGGEGGHFFWTVSPRCSSLQAEATSSVEKIPTYWITVFALSEVFNKLENVKAEWTDDALSVEERSIFYKLSQ